MQKVLILDHINKACAESLWEAGFEVKQADETSEQGELEEVAPEYSAILLRGSSKLPAEVIEKGARGRLKLIVRAGAGVDNIDVAAATRFGVIVENTPGTNTQAVVELTIGALIALARNLISAQASLKQGRWEKSRLTGTELKGKTLGVIGLGKIGQGVAQVAKSLGMRILGHDPLMTDEKSRELGIEPVSIVQIYRQSDFLTLHAGLNEKSRGMLNSAAFGQMKEGVCIVNCARAELVDKEALLEALDQGRVRFYFTDVFDQEPPPADDPLLAHASVFATPHLAGSTREATTLGARQAAQQVKAFFYESRVINAVNFAFGDERLRPWEHLAEKLGRFVIQYTGEGLREISVGYCGQIADLDTHRTTSSFFYGLLKDFSPFASVVNALALAEEEGIEVVESRSKATRDFIKISVRTDKEQYGLAATVSKDTPVLISINDYIFDLPLTEEHYIVSRHSDIPGVVGIIGMVLGRHRINIGKMILQDLPGRPAMAMITVAQEPTQEILREMVAGVEKKGGQMSLRKIVL